MLKDRAPTTAVPPPASLISQPKEIKLPQALEKVLAFKDVRVQQVGAKPEDMVKIEKGM